ncbi:MAG: translation initiation factor IF-2 [Planctomycetales bacterium]|nr:translation initiation factor IF-2 [Planctomycetales bacterium]
MDSKDLVDVCTKAGITGKGSALASLDDDEVTKVKSFLEGPKSAPKPAAPAPAAPERPTRSAAPEREKIRVIGRPRRDAGSDQEFETSLEPAAELPVEPVEPAPVVAEAPDAAPVEVEDEAKPRRAPLSVGKSKPREPEPAVAEDVAVAAHVAPVAEPVDPGAPMRYGQDPAAPMRTDSPPPEPKKPKPKVQPKRRAPVIHLPKMPKVEQPQPAAPAQAVPSQKPKVRLTREDYQKQNLAELEQAAQPAAAVNTGDVSDLRRKKEKGKKGKGEQDTDLAGMTGRQGRQQRRSTRKRRPDSEDFEGRTFKTLRHTGRNTALPRKGNMVVELPCTVRSFSEATGVTVGNVVKTLLMQMQVQANINAQLDDETAELLAAAMNLDVEFKRPETAEDQLLAAYLEPDDEQDLQPRPPIVTFLGHVDHGKTSLLDYLIGINVVSGEAGGITQHIRAYQVETPSGGKVSFVDTPGHAAFTEMRARGANVTDIVVLVIAADDGIMPQTEEAISHAKAAGVPIVVACNKIDLPGADPSRVMTQMTQYELIPVEWGGEIEVVKTSAITGEGMDDLLDTLLTIAELHEFRANPDRDATGTCIEAQQEPGRGVVAKLVVRNGTLRVGDNIVCGSTYGRVKAMFDTLDARQRVEEAGPSMPVNLTGFDTPPEAGDTFYVVEDIATAREIAAQRATQSRDTRLSGSTTKVSFIDFQKALEEGRLGQASEVSELNLIVRADVRGSVEAIAKELEKFEHPEVRIRLLQTSVGGITVGDVQLAHASNAVVVGFNVIPDEAARGLADELGVEIRRYDIIYKLTDDIKAMVEGKLKPEERVIELGRAVVKEVFSISRVGVVAGCYVIQGTIERGCRIRVNRDGRTIGDYPLDSLRRIKDDVKEVPRGMECGIKLEKFNDIKRDDLLEAYKIEEVARTL